MEDFFDALVEAGPVSLLTARHFQNQMMRSLVESHPLPEDLPEGVDLSLLEYSRLKKYWAVFRGNVRDRNCFMAAMPLDEDDCVFACVRFNAGKVTVEVLAAEDLPLDLLPQVECPEASRRTLMVPLKNEALHVGRNDPCPCGSGKKSKRCCYG
jgi:hypothetical protein